MKETKKEKPERQEETQKNRELKYQSFKKRIVIGIKYQMGFI